MNSYEITIVEPSVIRILEELEKKKLIKLTPIAPKERFKALLAKMRSNKNPPTMDEITQVVEEVRTKRYSRRHED